MPYAGANIAILLNCIRLANSQSDNENKCILLNKKGA
jgi:hypothetical protein